MMAAFEFALRFFGALMLAMLACAAIAMRWTA